MVSVGGLLGAVSLWGFGVIIGVIGLLTLVYWSVDEYREADDANEAVENIADRSGSALVVITGVILTIGDQLAQIGADIAGLIDSPVIVGHLLGGVLGWLGLQGTISQRDFLIFFAIVTLVAVVWRSSQSSGRGT
ncbi:hypothetical protein [Natronomonas sp. LN261]|uniref:hypothetical protein n=1 Tax=Natronomonas sp. LN261 TaxID=2750669 RepID=UPI0015EE6469|nr:hypothetical protein [Natronomonas sp. LN261]